jgi:hypothetical protein
MPDTPTNPSRAVTQSRAQQAVGLTGQAGEEVRAPATKPHTVAPSRAQQAVCLTGRAAEELRRNLPEPAKRKMLGRKAKQVTEETYRIVLSPEQQKLLNERKIRFAKPGKGNATVRLRDAATSKPVPEASLERVEPGAMVAKPSPAKVLGPVVWEAMAMATQQHYLVEIDKKLDGIAKGVDEVLAREDDRTLAIFREVRDIVRDSRERLDAGDELSSARVQEMHTLASDARREWHVLYQRTRRLLTEYMNGDTEREKVQGAWELLWVATEVLIEVSGLLTSLPYASVEDLLAASREEHDRVVDAVDDIRELAADMHGAHLQWRFDWLEWQAHGSRNPIKNRVRAIRRQPVLTKPAQHDLGYDLARQLRELLTPVAEPEAMLVTVKADGSVDVVPELAAA